MTVRLQCAACPWKTSTVPGRDIPGYSREKHESLRGTMAAEGRLGFSGALRVFACHESGVGREVPCVGWVVHQLGPGNNIQLRLIALDGRFDGYRTVGPQHERFEDTLP